MLSLSANASLSGSNAGDDIVEILRGKSHRGGSFILNLPAGRTNIHIHGARDFSDVFQKGVGFIPKTIHEEDAVEGVQAESTPPSSAFPEPVLRTRTMLLGKIDSTLPLFDYSNLFDTRGCAPAALEGRRPEASHMSGSHDDGRNKHPFGRGLATINYDDLEVRRVHVWSWVCISFSSLRATKILQFLSKLAKLCIALGMDICLEPTVFIHATTFSHYTDILDCLHTAREFFCDQKDDKAKLLVVLQDDGEYSAGSLDYLCAEYGAVYQCCICSQELNEKYLRDVASEIMFKVLEFTAHYSKVDSSDEEMEEDDGCKDEDEEVFDGTPSENSQQHVEKSAKKRKHADCDGLQVTKGIVENWACVCFAPFPEYKVYHFSEKLRHKCVSIGMGFCRLPKVFIMQKPACSKDIEDMLLTVHENYSDNSIKCKIDLLTVILPQARDFHVKIEEVCNHMGVVCQYFWPMSAISPRKKYLQKAAQEIKIKVVGLQTDQLQPFIHEPIPSVKEPTIIFGAGVSRGLSLQAVSLVASRSWPEVSRYRAKVICPTGSVAMHGNVIRDFLHAFIVENKKLAERIIFFRHVDGSYFNEDIVDGEIEAVKLACESMYMGYRPRITYVAVSTNESNDICPATDGDVALNPTKFEFSCEL